MMGFAQLAVGRVLNSLPEGLLIACGAWLLLRLMGRQNARTRFAIWLVALMGVAALPLLGWTGRGAGSGLAHPELVLPGFWAAGFLLLWAGAGAVALARVGVGLEQVHRLRKNCREVRMDELDPELREVMKGTKRRVQVLASEKARVPAAIGFRRPAIVLPEWVLRDLSTAELKPIVIHELAHVRRRDDWTNLLQKAVRAALVFHPAVWWIDARLSLERELACDDAVLAATGNAHAYAGSLIDLLERGCARRRWTMAQAAVARAREVSVRIARILREGAPRTTRVGRGALGLAAAFSLACAGVVVTAPRLVGFEPEHADSARVDVPAVEEPVGPPAAAVVPAMFHPGNRAAQLKPSIVHRSRQRRAPAEARELAASRRDNAPVVLARLNADRRETNDRAARQEEAPTFLLFTPAEQRHARAEAGGSVRPAAATGAGQGSAGVETIQMVQVIEQVGEQEGRQVRKVQILRLVLIVPTQGGTAQSI